MLFEITHIELIKWYCRQELVPSFLSRRKTFVIGAERYTRTTTKVFWSCLILLNIFVPIFFSGILRGATWAKLRHFYGSWHISIKKVHKWNLDCFHGNKTILSCDAVSYFRQWSEKSDTSKNSEIEILILWKLRS